VFVSSHLMSEMALTASIWSSSVAAGSSPRWPCPTYRPELPPVRAGPHRQCEVLSRELESTGHRVPDEDGGLAVTGTRRGDRPR